MIKSSYKVPVFHIVYANTEQINTTFKLIDTLIKSNICCCIVRRDDEEEDHLYIDSLGNVPFCELKEIFTEVVNHYRNDMSVNRITVNED